MANVKDICDFLDRLAPMYMKLDFDNVGLLAGFAAAPVTRVLTALDITEDVITEAADWGAELIVSHHPLIFHPARRITDDDPVGRKVIRLIRGGMSAICMHTNLDAAEGGVNDALMDALGAAVTGLLDTHGSGPDGRPYGIGRVGVLQAPMELNAFLARVKSVLAGNGLRYVAGGKTVEHIACCGGSGGGELEKAAALGCDTYVTADVKYDQFLLARDLGLTLIDADHFCTENVVVPRLRDWLAKGFPELELRISQSHCQAVQFY